jgi:hypothetical protein
MFDTSISAAITCISILGSLASIISCPFIIGKLKTKWRAEIYRDDKNKKIDVYFYQLHEDISTFIKKQNLKKFCKPKCFLYILENDRCIDDTEFDGQRKGQLQTQYLSFYKFRVNCAKKQYLKKYPCYKVEVKAS